MALPAPSPDRTCLVTGASSGIGAEIADRLAARGLGITLVARRQSRLEELAERLASTYSVRAEVVPADLAEEASRQELLDTLADRRLVVNVLVNNAGFSTIGPTHRSEVDRELAMVRTDVEAVVHLCGALLPGMVERRSGAVLNVASTVAFQPVPGQAAYGASKAFVLSYSEALRAEVRSEGVAVSALCPGPVHTGFNQVAGIGEAEATDALPRAMWVSPGDVADAAVGGLDANRAVIIPGLANRLTARMARLTPHALLVPLLAQRHPGLRP